MAKIEEKVVVLVETEAASELKKELRRVVEAIVEEDVDNYSLEATDYAIQTLFNLKNLKSKQPQEFVKLKGFHDFSDDNEGIPLEFRCPISGLLFKDPVVLASGQTYDQPFIQKWLKDGHQTCPRTDQLLPHTVLIPNHSIKKIIIKWCKLHNLEMPCTVIKNDEEGATNATANHLVKLVERFSFSSLSDAKRAVKELRMLTSRLPCFKALFADNLNVVPQLFEPILLERVYSDASVQEDFVAMILNISTHDSNIMKLVSAIPSAFSLVIESLKSERVETRSHAAAALSVLSALNSNKHKIAKSGAIKPLIDLIEEGHPLVLKDAALALLNLCTVVENREIVVSEGAVIVIVNKIIDFILIDEMLEILAMLSSHHRAIEEMEDHGGVYFFFNILKENISEPNKEICVAILHAVCFNDRRKLREITEVEKAYETLSQVAQTGTSRAKRKANGILERMNRFAFVSHTT